MKSEGIRATFKSPSRPKTTDRDTSAKFSPNILKVARPPTRIGEPIASDICPLFKTEPGWPSPLHSGSHVSTAEGWLYLAVVIDLFSRKILGWELSGSMHGSHVAGSIGKASRHLSGDALFHSYRGCQYTSGEIRTQIASLGMLQTMSAQGYCYDNATCEPFFASIKAEAFPNGGRFGSKRQAQLPIFENLETIYNRTRRHSSPGNLSPEQFLEQHSLHQNQHQILPHLSVSLILEEDQTRWSL